MLYVYRKKCAECDGIGVIKSEDIKYCSNCNNLNGTNCFICQNTGCPSIYNECSRCVGYGEIFYDATTKKPVFLYAVPSYRFIN